jgi:hypothetical protein
MADDEPALSWKFFNEIGSMGLSCLDVRPLTAGYFSALRWSWVRSCLRRLRGELNALALMLSADPLPRSHERA